MTVLGAEGAAVSVGVAGTAAVTDAVVGAALGGGEHEAKATRVSDAMVSIPIILIPVIFFIFCLLV
jgi:ABC-type dipeptide/oligopeptide/nickel transport system permease subunit